tara:strand:- start:1283 stop:2098 length:816 start_codon:yes stop_codon:yes gene_type:complete
MYIRNCPSCSKELSYSKEVNKNKAESKGSICMSCSKKGKNKGKDNPFYGKSHSKESKDKIKANRKVQDMSYMQTDHYKDTHRGSNNAMYNKSVHSVWIEKYGKVEADKKLKEFKSKLSIHNSGSNNPMFGKPSPNGSGNGWCGWYKEWHFRSLLELSFMVNVVERFGFEWQCGERYCKIPYIIDGKDRNYFPDLLLNGKYLIEIKPKNLMNSRINLIKQEFAIKYCEEHELKYKVMEPKRLTDIELKSLYENGNIIFSNKYELKYKNKYAK